MNGDPANGVPGPIRRICIVGGGTAGWIAAAVLAHQYRGMIAVDLVESDDIGTVGVGESTIPPFIQLLAGLGISESDFVKATQASFKLGIGFEDWGAPGHRYFHPFGTIGQLADPRDFYQIWLRAAAAGEAPPLLAFAPAHVMARAGKFMLPFKARDTPIAGASYALHVDAKRVARFLRGFAEERGVTRHEGIVTEVATRPDGFVERVILNDGRSIAADFFIDCSGFRALLIGKTLGVGYTDWSHWLLCDRAVAVQTENVGPPPPYTLAVAQPAGWRWRIPLQHRTGNGHVYSSAHMSEDEATALLLDQVVGETVSNPLPLRFTSGVRERGWDKNVLSLGLASGFIEPLESTAIHLVYRGLEYFLRFLPGTDCAPELADEYNRRMTADYEEIRDFVILHYCLTGRRDTAFWRACNDMELPPSLARRIALFRVNGTMPEHVDELFRAVSWQALMDGLGVRPRTHHPAIDRAGPGDVPRELGAMADALAGFVATLPAHEEFLARHCPAPAPAP
ncbi:tryptophan halogenase family protein [Hephaestia sp. GCM10023244]|uniref:tryptophan halogenase family protein n=1 Tax=unclassified Hephaestia TaxID=2631281 RepID=UPI0020776705|nr:tryptophan halogenase family protein [Hephaestia sp. MAHUQ-44]MCM8731722.1 tryptophan 7-halogenase [Hephaestia sp. MAHUQ-44]